MLKIRSKASFWNFQAESEEPDDLTVERSISRLVLKRIQKEFVGLGEKDKQAIEAMLNFSFYLSAGQMDNAFKSIRFIKKFVFGFL